MNSAKILLVVAFIVFSCINFSSSLKCFICDNKDACKKPQLEVCTPWLANRTTSYLDMNHKGVRTNATSSNYYCFQEVIKASSNEYQYKGCSYTTIQGCSYPLKDFHTGGKHSVFCTECSHKDGCNNNPADRAASSLISVLAVSILGVLVTGNSWF